MNYSVYDCHRDLLLGDFLGTAVLPVASQMDIVVLYVDVNGVIGRMPAFDVLLKANQKVVA